MKFNHLRMYISSKCLCKKKTRSTGGWLLLCGEQFLYIHGSGILALSTSCWRKTTSHNTEFSVTNWSRDKMATILQRMFWNEIFLMKIVVFLFEIRWNDSPGIILGMGSANERRRYNVSHWLNPWSEWSLLSPPHTSTVAGLCTISVISKHHAALQECYIRADSWFASSQWETVLLCNDVSHWLDANLESALYIGTGPQRTLTGHSSKKTFLNCFDINP